jgi:hypothetical protein
MNILEPDIGRDLIMHKKLLNLRELEAGIIGLNEVDAQEYVNKNAIWSATRLLSVQTKHDLSFLIVDK